MRGLPLVPQDLPLDPVLANRAVGIFKKLRIPDVPGTPTMAEAAGQWFLDIIAVIFGSLDAATSQRMVRGLFCLVPKKNAKTTYSAALMVTALLMNRRPLAEFILTAPSQEISDKAFSQAWGMIKLDDEGFLQKRLKVRDHLKEIEDLKTEAVLKIKTFDADIVTGAVVAGALIDEIHLLGKRAGAAAIIGQLRGGMVSVPEAFFAMITTQSFDPPAGVFKAELDVARAIRDGRARIDTLPVLYELPRKLQKDRKFWEDPRHWPLVTPNLGRSIWIPRLVKDLEEARLKGDAEVQRWVSQHLNIEIGLGLHSDRWAGADYWERNADSDLDLVEIIRRSDVLCMGADGGGLDDLLGLAVIGRCAETGLWLHWGHAWAHQSVLERRQEIAPALRDFADDGDVTIVERSGQDLEELEEICRDVVASGKLFKLGVDPAGVGGIVDAAKRAGMVDDQVAGISQGWKLSGAIKTAERQLADGRMRQCGQRLMAWAIGNAKVEPRGNAITITKQKAGSAKIDPLMAMFNGVTLMSMDPAPTTVQAGFFDLSRLNNGSSVSRH
jgi:phage terminase large subunit-like protein